MPSAPRLWRPWCFSPEYTRAIEELAGKAMAFDLSNPKILVGLLIGGIIPYLFAALCMLAVGKAAGLHR